MEKHQHRPFTKAAVLGAGVMGGGIASLLAAAGMDVLMLDVVPGALTEAEKAAGLTEASPAFRNRFAAAGLKRIGDKRSGLLYTKEHLDSIRIGNLTDDIGSLSDRDWIIEVVVERLDVKQSLMENIEKVRKPGSIVSTNTSGVSVNAIAEGRGEDFKRHFLGTHFFNPPRFMRLFEIIPGDSTDPEITAFIGEFARTRLGKGVVQAKDTPNFIGNRIGAFATLHTIRLAEAYGFDYPLVDELTGPVLGRPKSATFRTVDMVGLDILANVARNVPQNVDDPAEQARFAVPECVTKLIENGSLGAKTGQGFYKRAVVDGKKVTLAWDAQKGEYLPVQQEKPTSVKQALASGNKYAAMVYGDSDENRFAWDCIKSALLYSAGKVPEIADDYRLIDQAMTWGYNWEKGPFAIWDAIGLEKSVARMKAEGETIPAWIEQKLAGGSPLFYPDGAQQAPGALVLASLAVVAGNKSASLLDMGDGVLCLAFHSKGNAVDEKTLDMLDEAGRLLDSGEWRGLVIGNQGKNFCPGANLEMIATLAQDGKIDEIKALSQRMQAGVRKLKYSPKPVVAAIFGMTLGGGMEIALHSDAICAHAETYMGLVEAGVGLVPGAGGCKEMLLRAVGRCSGTDKVSMLPSVKKTWRNIATAAVSSSAFDARAKGYLRNTDEIVMNADLLLDRAKSKALQLAANGYMPPVRRAVPVLGEFGRASILFDLRAMLDGGFVSTYDAYLAEKLAFLLTGGGVAAGTAVSEEYLLSVEAGIFASLCAEEKTKQRIAHMLATGKPLRN